MSIADTIVQDDENFTVSDEFKFKFMNCSSDADCYLNIRTVHKCRQEIATCLYYARPCEEYGVLLSVNVTTDLVPQNTFWQIRKMDTDKAILSKGPYYNINTRFHEHICLEEGQYNFNISHTNGPYEEGGFDRDGNYQVYTKDLVIKDGKHFELYESTTFTICSDSNGCKNDDPCAKETCNQDIKMCIFDPECEECNQSKISLFFKTDNKPSEMEWEIINDNNEIIWNDRYYVPNMFYQSSKCVDKGGYEFKIYDEGKDGICCNEGDGHYELLVNDCSVNKGGNFSYSETTIFSDCLTADDCDDSDCSTSDYCNLTLNQCVFERTSACDQCGTLVSIGVKYYNSQPSWEIRRMETNGTVLTGGKYPTRDKLYEHSRCLALGMYSFSIADVSNDRYSYGGIDYGLHVKGNIFMEGTITLDPWNVKYAETFNFTICSSDHECNNADPCTRETCDQKTKICVFNPKCEECNKTTVSVITKTDYKPAELKWEITDGDNKVMFYGEYHAANLIHQKSKCLDKGRYEFKIHKGKYGIEGDGYYKLLVNDIVIKTGGNFNYWEKTIFSFCLSNDDCDDRDCSTLDFCNLTLNQCVFEKTSDCSECGDLVYVDVTTHRMTPEDTSWEIRNLETNQMVLSGGPYAEWKLYQDAICLAAGLYNFSIFDASGDGLGWHPQFDHFAGNYKLYTEDHQIKDGTTFGYVETTIFTVYLSRSDMPSMYPTFTNLPSFSSTQPSSLALQSLIPSQLPSATTIPTFSITMAPTAKCAMENKISKECGGKVGESSCCPGLVCNEYQTWRCVKGKFNQSKVDNVQYCQM